MDGTQDTGEFHFDNGIVTFKSYRPTDSSEFHKFDGRLTKYKFNYFPGKICFLRSTNSSIKTKNNLPDTILDLPKKAATK